MAACLSPLLINYIFASLPTLNTAWSFLVSALTSLVLLGGGTALVVLLLGFSVGRALLYVFLKFVCIGFARLAFSYVSILMGLIGVATHQIIYTAGGMAGLLGIALLFDGVFSRS